MTPADAVFCGFMVLIPDHLSGLPHFFENVVIMLIVPVERWGNTQLMTRSQHVDDTPG